MHSVNKLAQSKGKSPWRHLRLVIYLSFVSWLHFSGSTAAPTQLQITELNCDDLTGQLSWVHDNSQGAPVDYYLIEEVSSGDPVVSRLVFHVADAQTKHASFNLSGKSVSSLRVKAKNKFGEITSVSTAVKGCNSTQSVKGTINTFYTMQQGKWNINLTLGGCAYNNPVVG